MSQRAALREKLRIKPDDLEAVSGVLSSSDNRLVGLAVDGIHPSVLLDEVEKTADEAVVGAREDVARGLQVGRLDAQLLAQGGTLGHRESPILSLIHISEPTRRTPI